MREACDEAAVCCCDGTRKVEGRAAPVGAMIGGGEQRWVRWMERALGGGEAREVTSLGGEGADGRWWCGV